MRRMVPVLAAALLIIGGVGLRAASAATLSVCNAGCQFSSVQDAVNAAAAAGDTISIGPGTYAGAIVIDKNVTVLGAGAAQTTIIPSAPQPDSDLGVVTVVDGVSVTISSLTISGASAFSSGVYNAGALTFQFSVVSHNSGEVSGGGIHNAGALTVSQSTVKQNVSYFGGGGIENDGGIATIIRSTISDNGTFGYGGGIENTVGTVTIVNSTLTRNGGAPGGGIFNRGVMIVNSSTVSDNGSFSGGGGITNFTGAMTVNHTIIAANNAGNGGGGGILNYGANGAFTLNNSTVTENIADSGGGGISNYVTLTLNNSAVTDNSVNFGPGGGIWNGVFAPWINRLALHHTIVSGNAPDDCFGC